MESSSFLFQVVDISTFYVRTQETANWSQIRRWRRLLRGKERLVRGSVFDRPSDGPRVAMHERGK